MNEGREVRRRGKIPRGTKGGRLGGEGRYQEGRREEVRREREDTRMDEGRRLGGEGRYQDR